MGKLLTIKMLFLLLVLGLVLVVVGCSSTPGSTPSTQGVGIAPDFQLQSLDGETISLSDLRGRPVMLNFWASWCGPCRAEMPLIQEIFESEEWSDKGLVILAVNIGESAATAEEFMVDNNLSFPVLLDTSQEIAREYNIRNIPTTLFIDRDGTVQDIKIGAILGMADWEERLNKITE